MHDDLVACTSSSASQRDQRHTHCCRLRASNMDTVALSTVRAPSHHKSGQSGHELQPSHGHLCVGCERAAPGAPSLQLVRYKTRLLIVFVFLFCLLHEAVLACHLLHLGVEGLGGDGRARLVERVHQHLHRSLSSDAPFVPRL